MSNLTEGEDENDPLSDPFGLNTSEAETADQLFSFALNDLEEASYDPNRPKNPNSP